jgi:hypothetical protein
MAILPFSVVQMHQKTGVEKNRQGLSTLKIRVKRRLSICWHRPTVSF